MSALSGHYPFLARLDKVQEELLYYPVPTPGGGAKGAHAPPKRPQGIPCPPEKKLIIELMNDSKASFYSNTYAITKCKNGRALVKHGNFLP